VGPDVVELLGPGIIELNRDGGGTMRCIVITRRRIIG
jgi:hypothetical protein